MGRWRERRAIDNRYTPSCHSLARTAGALVVCNVFLSTLTHPLRCPFRIGEFVLLGHAIDAMC